MQQSDQFAHLDENAIKLRTQSRGGNQATLLRITPNYYNKVGMSFRLPAGDYVNAELTIEEFMEAMMQLRRFGSMSIEDSITTEMDKKNQMYGYLTIGRDSEGVVYLELGNKDKGMAKFEFLPKHMYRKMRNGQPAPPALFSGARAAGWSEFVGPEIFAAWKAAYKKEDKGQGGGGGRNFGGGQGGGNRNFGGGQGGNQGGGQGNYNGGNRNYGGGNNYPNQSMPEATGDLDDMIPM